MAGEKMSILENYKKILQSGFNLLAGHPEYERDRNQVIKVYHHQKLEPEVRKANGGLAVKFDKKLIEAIISCIEDANAIFRNSSIKDFNGLEMKIQFYNSLTKVICHENFIMKKQKDLVDRKIYQIINSSEFRLYRNLPMLEGSNDVQQFRVDFFDSVGMQDIDEEDEDEISRGYQMFYSQALQNFDRKLFIKVDALVSKFEEKRAVLGNQLCNKVDELLRNDIGKDDREIILNNSLMTLAVEESIDSNILQKQQIQKYYTYLQGVLGKFSGMKIFQETKLKFRLAKFGSNVSGFASKNTDLDLTILTDCYINEKDLLRVLYKFIEADLKEKFKDHSNKMYKLTLVDTARIPLIKIHFLSKELQQELHFDLIVNNILGVVNSQFLSVYASVPWVKNLGILIKLWGKKRDLISQWKFSSYSFILLMLNFLIETRRVNLIMDARSRQSSAGHFTYRRSVNQDIEEFDVYYQFKSLPSDVTAEKRANYYEILSEFFDYYKPGGKHWKLLPQERIITIDGSKQKLYDEDFIFTMKDPFDEKHNPGRVRSGEMNAILSKFEEASIIMKKKSLTQVMNLFQRS